MPGSNCSIFGCGTSRKSTGMGIFKLPTGKDDFNTKWRRELLQIITRDRVEDAALKRQICKDSIHICEKHFREDQLYICKFIFTTTYCNFLFCFLIF